MKITPISLIALGAAVLIQSACTKAQTKAERLKVLNAQLANWVPTGRPEDAQKRAALQSERALLAADLGYSSSTVMPVSAPVVAATPINAAPTVVVARDTAANAANRWQPMAGNSRWMDSSNTGRVYDHTIYSRSRYQSPNRSYRTSRP